MSIYSENLGEVVRSARAKTPLTQAQVAAKAGIDDRAVLNIENGKGNPKLEKLYRLSVHWILIQRQYFIRKYIVILPHATSFA